MPRLEPSARSSSPTAGIAPILVGLLLGVVGRQPDGWLGGLLQGAAVALIVLGAYLVGAARRARGRDGDGWLPSRDGRG